MSSETDHPRQRTVAELLAEHGDAAPTGRRRRRREPDESDDVAAPAHSAFTPAAPPAERGPVALPQRPVSPEPVWSERPAWSDRADRAERPALPDRSVLRDPVPPASVYQASAAPASVAAPRAAPEEPWARSAAPPAPALPTRPVVEPEHPTDVMPRFRDAPARAGGVVVDEGLTGPMPQQTPPRGAPDDDDAAGPSTAIGAAPVGAESWHEARTQGARRNGTSIDGGPPLPPGPVEADEQPAGLGRRKPPVESYDDDPDDAGVAPKPRERRLGRAAAAQESTGPAWATVMMQWVAGAVGGAVLWVAFRFLWRNLPVVALASAVLVTVGLVLIVRALLHNDDRRTTIFAVLVGLLLTVSPAILVLLGR